MSNQSLAEHGRSKVCRPLIDSTTDGHIHTRLCNHAQGELEDYVKAALACGLQQITFLEHLEVEIHSDHRTWLREQDFNEYVDTGQYLQKKYQNQITIKIGLEVGLNPSAIHTIAQHLARYPWDAIGLSYHFYYFHGRHYNMVSQRQENLQAFARIGEDRIVSDYFKGLIYGVQELPCTKICHLDAVLRYVPQFRFNTNHLQLIKELLLHMKKKEIALEINTSGFAIRNEPYPSKTIAQQAIEAGIPLIPGSDAHCPEQVGRFFNRLPAWL